MREPKDKTDMRQEPPNRDNSFDVVRLFAALLVLCGHSFDLTRVPAPSVAGTPLHVLGVQIFFSISGYLIAKSVLRDRNPVTYFSKRLIRILPGLWASIIVTVICLGFLSRLSIAEYYSNPQTWTFLQNMALYVQYFLPGAFEGNPFPLAVNGSLWSLAAEFIMYIFAFAALFFKRPGLLAVTAFYFFFLWNVDHFSPIWGVPASQFPPVASYFVAGAWLAVFVPTKILSTEAALLSLGVLILSSGTSSGEIMRPVLVTATVIALGLQPSRTGRALQRVGDLSYGTYLYAFPVQQTIISTGVFAGSVAMLTLSATVITLPLAALSWWLVEKPALKLKPTRKPAEFSAARHREVERGVS